MNHNRKLDGKNVIRLYTDGTPVPDIAKLYGTTKAAVYMLLQRHGVPRQRPPVFSLHKAHPDVREVMEPLQRAGLRYREIEQLSGYSASYIQNLTQHGHRPSETCLDTLREVAKRVAEREADGGDDAAVR